MKISNLYKILFLTGLLFLLTNKQAKAQCFEIESVLVDACGSPEGENEMLRFKVGSTALNSADISAVWASANAWLGICQNSASANAVATLNSTITGCGLLIEPTGGVLPANSSVLLITSTAIDASANSFAGLNDTLYVIFQCAGNTGGHFGNYSSSFLLRTVSLSFSSPAGCSDAVTYNKSLLLNQNLQSGGNSAIKNGATVNFDPAGNASYTNYGCQAPYNPIAITATNLSALTICPGDSINLSSTTIGAIQSIIWSGNSGTFSNSSSAVTTFFSSINDITPYYILVKGITSCNDTVYDSLLVNLNPPSNVVITNPDTVNSCQGALTTINATGTSPFIWSTGATTNSITVNTAGTYYVSASGNCPSNTDSTTINILPQVTIAITEANTINICQGDAITLHATGASTYIWSNGATTDSITINTAGNFLVTSNDNCTANSDSTIISITQLPTVNITNPDSINLCQGQNETLNVIGSSPFLWSTGATTNAITVNTAGVFYVSTTNNCATVFDTTVVNITPQLNINTLEPSVVSFCEGETITLHATGANSYIWNTGNMNDSLIVNTPGLYSVTANENCPSNTISIQASVIPQIIVTILEGETAKICPNSSTTLTASGGNNYIWNTLETTSSISVNTTGEYYVETKNGTCPSGFDTILIINEVPPFATIIGDSVICTEKTLTLNANGSGNFSWSSGDLGNSTTIFYAQELILTATNTCNETTSDTLAIRETDCNTAIYAPNTFTPNYDNHNDIFKVKGVNIQQINVKIFNKWGELIFEWDDLDNGWDGSYRNKMAETDIYIYTIQVTFTDGVNQRLTGHVTLLK